MGDSKECRLEVWIVLQVSPELRTLAISRQLCTPVKCHLKLLFKWQWFENYPSLFYRKKKKNKNFFQQSEFDEVAYQAWVFQEWRKLFRHRCLNNRTGVSNAMTSESHASAAFGRKLFLLHCHSVNLKEK